MDGWKLKGFILLATTADIHSDCTPIKNDSFSKLSAIAKFEEKIGWNS